MRINVKSRMGKSAVVTAMSMVLGDRRYAVALIVLIPLTTLAYYYLFTSYSVLLIYVGSVRLYAFVIIPVSIVLGVLTALNVMLLAYGAKSSGYLVGAVTLSVVSSTLCCTPLVPTLLSLITSQAFLLVGKVGGLVSTLSPFLITLSIALLTWGLYQGSRRVVNGCSQCRR